MESLAELARRQILEQSRRRAPMPRPATCQIVKSCSSFGIAAAAGISARDFLVSMDGDAGSGLGELHYYPAVEHTSVFYARGTHELVELRTTGADLGIEVAPTPDAIKAVYDPSKSDYGALLSLWEARDFAALGQLAEATLRKTGDRDNPALAFAAAAAWETGRKPEGQALATEYYDRYAPGWTMSFTAVALHYLGVAALDAGRIDQGVALLHTAFDHHPFDRTAQAIEKATGQRCPRPQPEWLSRPFPIDYRLPLLDSAQAGVVDLAQERQQMPAGRLLILCLLDGYRGNGPYNTFMSRYLGWARHFFSRIHGLHVITEEASKPEDRDYYFRCETAVQAASFPLKLLYDAGGAVGGVIRPGGSPHLMAIDRTGFVLHDGDLGSVEWWDALARLEARG